MTKKSIRKHLDTHKNNHTVPLNLMVISVVQLLCDN